MPMLCGGAAPPKDATPEVQKICDEVKAQSEEKAGMKFNKFKAKTFTSQVVAGTNYFIKVEVDGNKYVHLCVHKPLPHENKPLTLLRQETDKLDHETIGFF
ncbi:cystatin-B-like [Anguilla rostrata]|uniref:cystatin-B-like n=1 Tax=Anguilla rostrata TaxID=7938 RepID=UPI0030D0EE55